MFVFGTNERFGEYIGKVVGGVNLGDYYGAVLKLITKMVPFDA